MNSTDSVRQTMAEVRVDSVYVRDSIFIRERGDTVFVERWHDRWREHTTTQTDTVYMETTVNRASCTVNQKSASCIVHRQPPTNRASCIVHREPNKFYKWCAGIVLAQLIAAIVWLVCRWRNR